MCSSRSRKASSARLRSISQERGESKQHSPGGNHVSMLSILSWDCHPYNYSKSWQKLHEGQTG